MAENYVPPRVNVGCRPALHRKNRTANLTVSYLDIFSIFSASTGSSAVVSRLLRRRYNILVDVLQAVTPGNKHIFTHVRKYGGNRYVRLSRLVTITFNVDEMLLPRKTGSSFTQVGRFFCTFGTISVMCTASRKIDLSDKAHGVRRSHCLFVGATSSVLLCIPQSTSSRHPSPVRTICSRDGRFACASRATSTYLPQAITLLPRKPNHVHTMLRCWRHVLSEPFGNTHFRIPIIS